MLINALNEYYDVLNAKGRLLPEGVSAQQVTHCIMLRNDGTIDSIVDIREEQRDKKGKVYYVPVIKNLPERTQKPGIDFNIIEHRPLYIFGLNYDKKSGEFTAEDNTDKAKKSHRCFAKGNLEFTEGMTSEMVTAYRNFIKNWTPEKETQNEHLLKIAKEYPSAYFCFALAGLRDELHNPDGEIMKKVRACAEKEPIPDGICAVSGKQDKIARIHDKIKGIRGGQAAGGLLVCFNSTAEESYGKEQSYNSAISETVMKRYTTALNSLTASKNHHMYIEDLTVVFWAMSENDNEVSDVFLQMLGGDGQDADDVNDIIKNALEAAKEGKKADLSALNIDENVTFYIAGLAPNNSRISQKFIYRDKFGKIFENIVKHQNDIMIDGAKGQIPLWRMNLELKSPKSKKDTIPPPLLAGIFQSILSGGKYPEPLLETVIRRVKTDKSINYVRAGIIKACLNRKIRINKETEEFKMALDKDCNKVGYVCGRLFAVLERIQETALGADLNKTIRDTYFSSASSNPASVFPNLISLSQNHLKKIKGSNENTYVYYEKLIGEITDKLEASFPNTLSVDEQGSFDIGYYHQRQNFFKSNKNNEE